MNKKGKHRSLVDIESELIDARNELERITIDPNSEIENYLWNAPKGLSEKEQNSHILSAQRKLITERKIELTERIAELEKEKLQSTSIDTFCTFENNSLILTLNDGTKQAITFSTKRKTRHMFILFKILYEHWNSRVNKPLPKSEIRIRMREQGVQEEINDILIKDTISNIRKSKINPLNLSGYISITYDKISDGYLLNIKRPNK